MTRPPALVLTAGLGTRLRPLTQIRAKAAVPINGESLATRAARWLAASGFSDLVFNLHHHPASITGCLGDGSHLDVRIRYSWETEVLGSGGGPRHALPLLTDGGHERFLIVNGDTLTDVDLDAVLSMHARSGALVTMCLIPNPAPDKYGGVLANADGFVTAFTRRGAVSQSYHFIGVQVVEAHVFLDLEDGVPAGSVGELYPRLMSQDPRSVAAFICNASFQDIGTPADCLHTTLDLASVEGPRLIGARSRVDESAVIDRSALWDDVTVEAGARLTECIVADGATIPRGAVFERSAIVRGADGLIVHPL